VKKLYCCDTLKSISRNFKLIGLNHICFNNNDTYFKLNSKKFFEQLKVKEN